MLIIFLPYHPALHLSIHISIFWTYWSFAPKTLTERIKIKNTKQFCGCNDESQTQQHELRTKLNQTCQNEVKCIESSQQSLISNYSFMYF